MSVMIPYRERWSLRAEELVVNSTPEGRRFLTWPHPSRRQRAWAWLRVGWWWVRPFLRHPLAAWQRAHLRVRVRADWREAWVGVHLTWHQVYTCPRCCLQDCREAWINLVPCLGLRLRWHIQPCATRRERC